MSTNSEAPGHDLIVGPESSEAEASSRTAAGKNPDGAGRRLLGALSFPYRRGLGVFNDLTGRLDQHTREVVRGTLTAIALKPVAAITGFALNVLLARLLDVRGLGLYYEALSVVSIAVVLGMGGVDLSVVRFIGAECDSGGRRVVRQIYKKGLLAVLLWSSIVAAAMFAAAPFIARVTADFQELEPLLRWMALAVAPMALLTLYSQFLRGLKRIRDSLCVLYFFNPVFYIASCALMIPAWGLNGAVWGYSLAALLALGVAVLLWQNGFSRLDEGESRHFGWRELFQNSHPLFWATTLQVAVLWMPTYILSIWQSPREVGLFGAALRVAVLTSSILQAVNSISAPKFAALYSRGDMKALERVARNSTMLMSATAFPILLFFVFGSGWVMRIFGPQFVEAAPALIVLSLGRFVGVAAGSVGILLNMSGHVRDSRNNMIVTTIISLVLNVVLISYWGVMGAAVAAMVALVAQNVLQTRLVYLRLGITVFPSPAEWGRVFRRVAARRK